VHLQLCHLGSILQNSISAKIFGKFSSWKFGQNFNINDFFWALRTILMDFMILGHKNKLNFDQIKFYWPNLIHKHINSDMFRKSSWNIYQ
jgi:hypothetical protein